VFTLVKRINNSQVKELLISPTIVTDDRLLFFKEKSLSLKPFSPNSVDDFFGKAENGNVVVFDPDQNIDLAKQIIAELQAHPELSVNTEVIIGPGERVDFIILGKL
jgi:hypothetical protein